MRKAIEIANIIADAGAMIGDERKGIVSAAAAAIRAERRNAVPLSKAEKTFLRKCIRIAAEDGSIYGAGAEGKTNMMIDRLQVKLRG